MPIPFCLRCPICGGGTITKMTVDYEPFMLYQWACNLCKTEYGPPWRPEMELPTFAQGKRTHEPDEINPFFSSTMNLLTQKAIQKGEIKYLIVKVLVSLIFAGASMLLQLRGFHSL